MQDWTKLGIEIGGLVNEKELQYGSAYKRCGEFVKLLYPEGVSIDEYAYMLACVRIFDKMCRIASPNRDKEAENPFRDIAGYGLLGSELWEKGV